MRPSVSPVRSRGFALPWVLFTLVVLALLAASGFLIAWLEGRSARAFSLGTAAYWAARGGLATAVATAAGPSPSLPPIALGRATARVTFEPLLDLGPGERLFRVESEGSVSSGGSTLRRRVGRLLWVAAPPRARAALVAWGGLTGTAPTGVAEGFDTGGGGCPGVPPSVAGLATLGAPAPAFPGLVPTGSPPGLVWPAGASLAAETGLRWAELLAPWGPAPDATVPPDPWPSAGGWPFIRLAGPAAVGPARSGRGTLLVDGDLALEPGFAWTGLVLVGGTATFAGPVRIRGSLSAGLASGPWPAIDLGAAALDVRYDACSAGRAAARLTAPAAALPGTWYEVW